MTTNIIIFPQLSNFRGLKKRSRTVNVVNSFRLDSRKGSTASAKIQESSTGWAKIRALDVFSRLFKQVRAKAASNNSNNNFTANPAIRPDTRRHSAPVGMRGSQGQRSPFQRSDTLDTAYSVESEVDLESDIEMTKQE